MQLRFVSVVACVVLGVVACASSDPPPPKPVSPYPGKPGTWGAPDGYPPPTHDPARLAEADAQLAPCETDDDCWMDEGFTPINRPSKERGKKIDPCKNGGRLPACADKKCVVRTKAC